MLIYKFDDLYMVSPLQILAHMNNDYLIFLGELIDKYNILNDPAIRVQMRINEPDIFDQHWLLGINRQMVPKVSRPEQFDNRNLVEYEILLENVGKMAIDVQHLILARTKQFSQLMVCRGKCHNDAVRDFSQERLKELNICQLGHPTTIWLEMIWKSLLSNVTKREFIALLDKYNEDEGFSTKEYAKWQMRVSKSLTVVSIILFIISFVIGLWGFVKIYSLTSLFVEIAQVEYLPRLINIIINYCPISIINSIVGIYDYRWWLLILFGILRLTRLSQSSLFQVIDKVVYKIAWFPWEMTKILFWLPIQTAGHISGYVSQSIRYLSGKSYAFADKIMTWKFSRERALAQDKFIKQFNEYRY